MNYLSQYPFLKFDQDYYNKLSESDQRFILRQLQFQEQHIKIDHQITQELFTLIYSAIEQMNKGEQLLDLIKSFLENPNIHYCQNLQFLQLRFLQEYLYIKNKSPKITDIYHTILFSCQFQSNLIGGEFILETLLKIIEIKIKEQDVKHHIIKMIVQNIKNNPNNEQFIRVRLIQMLFNSDDIENQISELVEKIDNINFTTTLVTLLAHHCLEIHQQENIGLKQVSKFLNSISQSQPRIFHQNCQVFMEFYNSENYILRNAANQIITNILVKHLNPAQQNVDSELMEIQHKQRLLLIEKLFSRILDKNAHARINTLKMLRQVCESNLIPAIFLLDNLKLILNRINDQSSNVRKAALSLLKQIIKFLRYLFVDGMNLKYFLTISDIKTQIDKFENEIKKLDQAQEEIHNEIIHTQDQENFKDLEEERNIIALDKKEKTKLLIIFRQYQDFMVTIQDVIPQLYLLLSSKLQSDVKKTISLVTFLYKNNIEETEKCVWKMIMHILNPIHQQQVATKIFKLYFNQEQFDDAKIIQNILELLKKATIKDLIFLEQVLDFYIKNQKLSLDLYEKIWTKFQQSYVQQEADCIQYSIIIRIIYRNQVQLFNQSKYDCLIKILAQQKSKQEADWLLIIELIKLVQKLQNQNQQSQAFQLAFAILSSNFGTPDVLWFQACQEIMNLCLNLPVIEKLYEYIIRKLTFKLIGSTTMNITSQNFLEEEIDLVHNDKQMQLAQLLFIIGHATLQILIHSDEMQNKLKHLKNYIEAAENELDKISGGCEAEYEQFSYQLNIICEQNILGGELMFVFIPIILNIIKKERYSILYQMAVLTLSKFMCLSEKFCEKHIDKLFDILRSDASQFQVKNNIIIAIGDLLLKWPNTVTPKCRQLFQGLSNQEFIVKKTSLNVLFHLIFNDMIKIKREISDIALLLSDLDENIQISASIFFYQLNKKDNKILLNSLPDIISNLSLTNDNSKFTQFLNHTSKYLDKNSDLLIEKLLSRFKENISDFEALNVALTLNSLSMKESFGKRLYEYYPYYKERFSNSQIREVFYLIIKKVQYFCNQLNKFPNNLEIQQIITEFEEVLSKGGETKRRILSKNKSYYQNDLSQFSTQN